jgi:N utilization substance protein B
MLSLGSTMIKKTPRHLARSFAVQGIYYYKNNEVSVAEIEQFISSVNPALYPKANYQLLNSLLQRSIDEFEPMINLYAEFSDREIKQINLIEQAILVIAAVELTYDLNVPAPVIINEAVELAKLYGGEDSFKFINNLVDKLANTIRPK